MADERAHCRKLIFIHITSAVSESFAELHAAPRTRRREFNAALSSVLNNNLMPKDAFAETLLRATRASEDRRGGELRCHAFHRLRVRARVRGIARARRLSRQAVHVRGAVRRRQRHRPARALARAGGLAHHEADGDRRQQAGRVGLHRRRGGEEGARPTATRCSSPPTRRTLPTSTSSRRFPTTRSRTTCPSPGSARAARS